MDQLFNDHSKYFAIETRKEDPKRLKDTKSNRFGEMDMMWMPNALEKKQYTIG